MSAFGTDDHDLPLPRLLHSANSSQANLILKGLSTNSGFEHSRWALKFIIVSSDIKNQTLEVDSRKNVNDENSPGVFTVSKIYIFRTLLIFWARAKPIFFVCYFKM